MKKVTIFLVFISSIATTAQTNYIGVAIGYDKSGCSRNETSWAVCTAQSWTDARNCAVNKMKQNGYSSDEMNAVAIASSPTKNYFVLISGSGGSGNCNYRRYGYRTGSSRNDALEGAKSSLYGNHPNWNRTMSFTVEKELSF